MSRQSRNSLNTDYYHVMTQGVNKSYIFEKTEEKNMYIKYMNELKEEIDIKIIAFCIMGNHAHLLINCSNVNKLSLFMKRLNGKYGMYYNWKYQRVGIVFRNRYNCQGIYTFCS